MVGYDGIPGAGMMGMRIFVVTGKGEVDGLKCLVKVKLLTPFVIMPNQTKVRQTDIKGNPPNDQ